MASLWADSTMYTRRQLVERWLRYATLHHLPLDAESAVLFVMAQQVSIQGQLAYIKALSGTFGRLGLEHQDLINVASALRAQGAEIPQTQAYAMTKREMLMLADACRHDPMLLLAVLLCWKTASRWGEIALLQAAHLTSVSSEEVVIAWGTLPKGRRGDPYTPSMYTVVVGDLTARIAALLARIPRHAPFCPMSTQQFDAWTRTLPPPLNQVTGHSFKKGAASHIVQMVTEQDLPLDPRRLSLLLKHKLTADLIGASTLRYPQMGVALARWLGTAEVTRLL